jgi:aspartyl-tRNA(Asn)/glutamyl-tRNA(Gln) amidotransferase subunit C
MASSEVPGMAIDRATVEHVAKLARLALTDEEKARFVTQLTRIVGHFQALRAAPLEGVPAASHALSVANVLRDDVVTPSLARGEVLAAAPAHDGAFFVVPPIFEAD